MRKTIASLFAAFALALVLTSPSVRAGGDRNGRIAFIKGPDIYTIAPDGSYVRQLTRLGPDQFAELPSWEPDDDQIVYTVRLPDLPRQLWVMNANGGNQHRLLDDPAYGNTAGTFSPDGRIVIFSRCDMRGACGIYQVGIDGTGLTAIMGLQPGITDSSPVYSPSGLTIGFEQRSADGASGVFLMDRNGENIRRLTPAGLSARHPAWSPDGSRIAFSCQCDASRTSAIWVVDRDGGGLTRLTYVHASNALAADYLFPSWSPDGNFLAVEQRAPGSDPRVVVVNLMSAGLKNQRINQLLLGEQPSWSQAPSVLAFFLHDE
jgi:TolB protein